MSTGDIVGGIGSAIGSIGNMITGAIGAYDTSKWNEKGYKLAKQQFDYQRYWNQRQMSWLDDMARTAHQREVADLRAAGLNPILSGLGGSGAPMVGSVSAPHPTASYSSGAGAVAQGWQTAMSGISAAGQILQGYNRLANESKVADATAKKLETEAAYSAKQVGRYDGLIDAQIEKLQSSAKGDRAKAAETLELLFDKKDLLVKQAQREASTARKQDKETSYMLQEASRKWVNTFISGVDVGLDAINPGSWIGRGIRGAVDGARRSRAGQSGRSKFNGKLIFDQHGNRVRRYDSELQEWK